MHGSVVDSAPVVVVSTSEVVPVESTALVDVVLVGLPVDDADDADDVDDVDDVGDVGDVGDVEVVVTVVTPSLVVVAVLPLVLVAVSAPGFTSGE